MMTDRGMAYLGAFMLSRWTLIVANLCISYVCLHATYDVVLMIIDHSGHRASSARRFTPGSSQARASASSRRWSSMKTSSMVAMPNRVVISFGVPTPIRWPRDRNARRSQRSASSM